MDVSNYYRTLSHLANLYSHDIIALTTAGQQRPLDANANGRRPRHAIIPTGLIWKHAEHGWRRPKPTAELIFPLVRSTPDGLQWL